jgi:CRISPR/Cas system CSM-associated protein Csm2 small subunit
LKKRKRAESSESKVKKVKRDETLLFDPTVHSDKEDEVENLKTQLKRFLDKKRNQNIGDLKCISMTESMNRNDIEMHDLKYIEAYRSTSGL